MAKMVTCLFLVSSLVLWYFVLFDGSGNDEGGGDGRDGGGGGDLVSGSVLGIRGVGAISGHGSAMEGRDPHHHHIRRDLNHCWRRYDGYNLQTTIVNKKEQLKKPYGILCNFKCTWFFTVNFPTCEFIYDYKLSCYLFTSLPDCTAVKCTLLNFFT